MISDSSDVLNSYPDLQVTCVMAVCHSMGARLAALAVKPRTLQQGLDRHKIVYIAADMLQQDFVHQLVSAAARDVHNVSVLLASAQDKALKWSQRAHTYPNPLLDAENMDGSGSRAGSCATSLCCRQTAFTTIDCSGAQCCDRDNHDYICSSPAVIACLSSLFSDIASWDAGQQVSLVQTILEENNNGSRQALQVRTLIGP